jgi:hypothetical protein
MLIATPCFSSTPVKPTLVSPLFTWRRQARKAEPGGREGSILLPVEIGAVTPSGSEAARKSRAAASSRRAKSEMIGIELGSGSRVRVDNNVDAECASAGSERSGEDPLARRRRAVALRQAARPGKVYLAVGEGGRRVDLAGADGLNAGRNRLEEPATDVPAEERGLSATTEAPARRRKTWDHTLFRAPQITRTVILRRMDPAPESLPDDVAALKAAASATEEELAAERVAAKTTTVRPFTRRHDERDTFPDHLPRERVVIESADDPRVLRRQSPAQARRGRDADARDEAPAVEGDRDGAGEVLLALVGLHAVPRRRARVHVHEWC